MKASAYGLAKEEFKSKVAALCTEYGFKLPELSEIFNELCDIKEFNGTRIPSTDKINGNGVHKLKSPEGTFELTENWVLMTWVRRFQDDDTVFTFAPGFKIDDTECYSPMSLKQQLCNFIVVKKVNGKFRFYLNGLMTAVLIQTVAYKEPLDLIGGVLGFLQTITTDNYYVNSYILAKVDITDEQILSAYDSEYTRYNN